jgi:hypothetical protein
MRRRPLAMQPLKVQREMGKSGRGRVGGVHNAWYYEVEKYMPNNSVEPTPEKRRDSR